MRWWSYPKILSETLQLWYVLNFKDVYCPCTYTPATVCKPGEQSAIHNDLHYFHRYLLLMLIPSLPSFNKSKHERPDK